MRRVRKHLHVTPQFNGFDVSHLNNKVASMHHHSKTFWMNDKGLMDTLDRLEKVDKSGRLHRKLLTLIHVAHSTG